jgi:hypothetical protein
MVRNDTSEIMQLVDHSLLPCIATYLGKRFVRLSIRDYGHEVYLSSIVAVEVLCNDWLPGLSLMRGIVSALRLNFGMLRLSFGESLRYGMAKLLIVRTKVLQGVKKLMTRSEL